MRRKVTILAISPNLSIDVSASTDFVTHERKLHCAPEGGGRTFEAQVEYRHRH